MPTPIGQNTLTSIARHYILPQVTDNVYLKNNALLYRLVRSGKRLVQGGTQIEVPLLYRRFSNAGGPYRGFDLIDSAPQDPVKNAAWDWKQYASTFAIDGLSLVQTDSPLAIANQLHLLGQQMYMEMGENLSAGIFSNGTNPKAIDGLGALLSTSNTYGGINRTTNSWWGATLDTGTTTLALDKMRGLFGMATFGGTHPTIWFGNGTNYNRLYALNLSTSGYGVSYNREPGGSDEILAQAGFTNLLFENVPFVRDDNAQDDTVMALNEDFLSLVVSPRADFFLTDFEKPTNQDAYVSTLLWAGNLVCMNAKAQAAFTALTA